MLMNDNLREITNTDLQELGLPLGPRKTMADNQFTEGFDTLDLKAARALLEALPK